MAQAVINPFRDDSTIVALLRELDNITTRRQFRRWRKSFLEAFEVFLEQDGCVKVRAQYRRLCEILSRHVEQVKKTHAHIQMGDLSPEGCTVKSRQTLGNFFDQMIRVKQVLIDLLPTTARMEKEIGYTKFHLAAVLIDNGFVAYDRLSLCDEIHFHFKKWCLQDVANKLFLLEMDHYHNQLNIFCDILADLGLSHAMEVCRKFLHLDDEETILWEGDDTSHHVDDDDLSSDSEKEDLDPLPDLSDITFDDEASLNLPLWKVNEFYYDNAKMAEQFRSEMKRKSFAMFGGSGKEKSEKPPSMPKRSSDRDVSPPPRNDDRQCLSMPQRRLSNGSSSPPGKDSPEHDDLTAKTKGLPTKSNQSSSLSSSIVVYGTEMRTTKESSRESVSPSCVSPVESSRVLANDPEKRSTSHGSRKGGNRDKVSRSKHEKTSVRDNQDKTSGSKGENKSGNKKKDRKSRSPNETPLSGQSGKPTMDTTKRMSNCTMETASLSDMERSSSDGESFRGEEDEGVTHVVEPAIDAQLLSDIRREGLRRVVGTNKFILPPTNYLATPKGKISEIRRSPGKASGTDNGPEKGAAKQEGKPENSFYSFANYYHGNPSDWKPTKVTQ